MVMDVSWGYIIDAVTYAAKSLIKRPGDHGFKLRQRHILYNLCEQSRLSIHCRNMY